jgi:guanylate kinase
VKGKAAPVVLAGPSGAGKTTLAQRLVGGSDQYVFSVSATTRDPRNGECDGVDYHFVDEAAFRAMVEDGDFVEWAEVHDRLYGTPRAAIDKAAERGEHVVLDIDVQGARQIRDTVPDATLIFVLPPNVDIMMARLVGRGTESPDAVARRLRTALTELEAVDDFDYVVVNDDLGRSVDAIKAIVERRDGDGPEVYEKDVEEYRAEIADILDAKDRRRIEPSI